MRIRIHHSVFAGFLAVIGVLVALLAVLQGSRLRAELITEVREELVRHLAVAEWSLATYDVPAADSVARLLTRRIGYRVTLIDTTGVVLGDSYVERGRLNEVENHAGRPEVRQALAGGSGYDERTSATVGEPFLYASRRVALAGHPVVLRIAAPLADVDAAISRARRTVLLSGMLAAILGLVVAYGFSVAASMPLARLAEGARHLAAGDLDRKVPRGSGFVELEELAVAFNRLGEELRRRLGELGQERDEMQTLIDCMAEGVIAVNDDARIIRVNRAARTLLDLPEAAPLVPVGALVRDPELRRALEESVSEPFESREIKLGDRHLLVSAGKLDVGGAVTTFLDITELRRLEQVRRDFVANASHELKTPLTSIRGFAETLLEGDPPEPLRSDFLTFIRNNTLRLQRLVDDLLDLSRLESGGWKAHAASVNVAAVAREAWEQVSPQAAEKRIELTVEGAPRAHADRSGLVQVFLNLMENAVRHADDGGHVRVVVSADGEAAVVVEVSDDGEGIPSKMLPRIFERFYRADSARGPEGGGTGLGLAVVRHLVTAMGGEVSAESELGRGTTIRFTLPSG